MSRNIHPENISFRKITKMDHNQSTAIKTQINPIKLLPRLQFISNNKNLTQSVLRTHMTILTLWKIPTKTLILLIHNNKTDNMVKMNKKIYLKSQPKTITKKNCKTFTQTLITIFHHQKWTQVSWLFIIMIQKDSLMIQKIFENITYDS